MLLGTSHDHEYEARRYVEVLEVWISHIIFRLADALFNFFGIHLTEEQKKNEHPLEFVSHILKVNEYFMNED